MHYKNSVLREKITKISIILISILAVLSIPIMIYGANFNLIAFDADFYKEQFFKHSTYNNLKSYDIGSINQNVLSYLYEQKDGLIEEDFFNEREKKHLLDVKILIGDFLHLYKFTVIFFLSLLFFLALLLRFRWNAIAGIAALIAFFGSLLTLFFAFAVFFLSIIGFERLFQRFHETFFLPETFLFDPSFEKIVVVYPENMFFDLLAKILTYAIFSSVIILILSSAFLLRKFLQKFFKKIRREAS